MTSDKKELFSLILVPDFNIPLKIADETEALKLINNQNIHIGVLLGNENVSSGKNLVRYLLRMGLDTKNIAQLKNISKAPKKMTHLICYQINLMMKLCNL